MAELAMLADDIQRMVNPEEVTRHGAGQGKFAGL